MHSAVKGKLLAVIGDEVSARLKFVSSPIRVERFCGWSERATQRPALFELGRFRSLYDIELVAQIYCFNAICRLRRFVFVLPGYVCRIFVGRYWRNQQTQAF